MTISNEAVEAAARAIYEQNPCGEQDFDADFRPTGPGCVIRFDELCEYDASLYELSISQGRAALEAAAPHMLQANEGMAATAQGNVMDRPVEIISENPDVCFIEAALSWYDGGPAGDDVRQAWSRLKDTIHAPHMLPAPEGVSEDEIVRHMTHEEWRGCRIESYRWKVKIPEALQGSEWDWSYASHWSTPVPHEEAEALVSVKDAERTLLAALASERERAERADGERDDAIARWCIRMADVREASGIGVKPMLDEVPAAIKARMDAAEARVQAAEARVRELEAPTKKRPLLHSLSACAECGVSGEDFASPNVEAFEVTGELVCDDCADAVLERAAEAEGEE